jgi:uncharacterized protein YjbI with pentapeptide repeats
MGKWLRKAEGWIDRNRPWTLLGTVTITLTILATINWLTGADLFRQFFFPENCDPKMPLQCDPLEWKELFQAGLLILGLPVAFLLWHWRDRNVRDQIEAQRKDINLKEFQEVQLRAVGTLSGGISDESKNILQVAALHQLRGFLKGEYGSGFKRPAFETYCALLSRNNSAEWEEGDDQSDLIADVVFKALRIIVHEDWSFLFWEDYERRLGWPLAGRSFHSISLPPGANLAGHDLSKANFYGSQLDNVTFSESRCWDTNFSDCSLRGAIFMHCECEDVKFNRSDLSGAEARGADFSGASLTQTKFHGGDFSAVSFAEANGENCQFVNVDLQGSLFNAAKFVGANFQNCRLDSAKFVSAQIAHGNIAGAEIDGCDFSYAYLDGFFPDQAQSCKGVILKGLT